jgi:NADPH2:quinone reductase
MKAIIVNEYGGPEVLCLGETAIPEPKGSEVLVRVKAAGVNPVDTYVRAGQHATAPPVPFIPGKDGAGIVEATGADVRRVRTGDRVYIAGAITGTYAEYALCTEEQVRYLPDNVSFEQGAGVFVPYATAYRALFHKAEAKAGETVLVHGASGAVGIASIQWAKNAGLRVIGTAGSEAGRELAAAKGADLVFDHSSEPEFSYLDEIREATGGVEIILEMLANRNLQEDFRTLKMFGRIVVIGSRGALEFNPRLIMGKDATVRGVALFNSPPEAIEEMHGKIGEGLAAGYLVPEVGRTFSLEDAAEAHRQVIESKAYGKIVLSI